MSVELDVFLPQRRFEKESVDEAEKEDPKVFCAKTDEALSIPPEIDKQENP